MATTDKKLYRGTLTNTKATLYTTPASTKTYIKAVSICNWTAALQKVDLWFGGKRILFLLPMPAYSSITIPFFDQILDAAELIEGNADANDKIDVHISGKEVT